MAINQEIVDRYVEYRAYLVRYENRVVRDLLEVLRRGEEQAIGGIVNAYGPLLAQGNVVNEWDGRGIGFRRKALARVRASLADVFPEATQSLRLALEGVALDVQDEFLATLESQLPKPVIDELALSRVPERQLAIMLEDKFGERLQGSAAKIVTGMKKIEADALARVDRVLVDAVRDGLGMRQIQTAAVRAIGTEVNSTLAREVSNYARSMVQTAANDAAGMLHMENSDIVRAEQFVATLDDDTCPICGALDGKVFPITSKGATIPRPIRHPGCRCMAVPVLSDWKAMGLPSNVSKDVKRLLDGKPAPRTTWADWVQRNPERLKNALGPTRAAMVDNGTVTLRDLVTRRDVLNLDELAERMQRRRRRAA